MILVVIGGMLVTLAASLAWPTFGHAVLTAANVVVIGWLGSYLMVAIDKKEFVGMLRILVVITAVGIVASPLAGLIVTIKEGLGW